MNKLVIQTHNFEKAKNQLKEFSLTKPEELALKEVEINGGLFNWFDHKVTGQELNDLTNQIQGYLVKFNTLNTKFIKEFGEVYNALEALDKEYIQAILISIKAAEKASKEAKDAQQDINKTIEVQKQTITVLKKFKEKLDKYEHLENVDEVWKDTQRFGKELKFINKQIDNIKQTSEEQSNSILQLDRFLEELSKFKHLAKIDVLWEEVQVFKRNINSINEQIKNSKNVIEFQGQALGTLQNFKKDLNKLNHLYDIDQVWENTQTICENIDSINEQISDFKKTIKVQANEVEALNQFIEMIRKYKHLKDIDQIWEDVQKSKFEAKSLKVEVDDLEERLLETKQQMGEDKTNYESQINSLFKKTKIAYALAGGSIGIALLQFLLSLMGILK
ncbi:hypothetical protein [Lysinibacillus capsici]|uniref:hypothetical protein n=1 Tax=Lysinibacillus capsici TaxID=2115968 RepID=UPI002152423B|nr:hypothetical protein [Lysinibacillus capsici]MCR6524433.1 hypothetical protein [Lysinibacillus capsici]